MKKNTSIRLILFGIASILFYFYAVGWQENQGETASFFATIILAIGAYSPLIGYALCIIGLFIKEK